MGLNGCMTQLFGCGFHLGSWTISLWLFLGHRGELPHSTKLANFPLLKARWAYSVFYWYSHLAAVFASSFGLENIIKFTQ